MSKRNIPLFKPFSAPTICSELQKVFDSNMIGQGSKNIEYEEELKKLICYDYVATVNSGTSAEYLAIQLLRKSTENWPGWEPGDEVLSQPITCLASNTPSIAHGLDLKWVDVDKNNLNMDLNDLARKITPKTKIIMLVHWGGYPTDLDKIKLIQKQAKEIIVFSPAVIEDCAHSFGTYYKGKHLGRHGNICSFSFQAIKTHNSGDGGMLTLPHIDLWVRAKNLRWFGINRETGKLALRCEDDVAETSLKLHMNDINSCIGLENLKHFDSCLTTQTDNGKWYDKNLADIDGITLFKREKGFDSSYWLYTFMVDDRTSFIKSMANKGIMCSQVHETNVKHSALKEFKSILPTVDEIMPKIVSIPVGWWVTPEDREYIIQCIKEG